MSQYGGRRPRSRVAWGDRGDDARSEYSYGGRSRGGYSRGGGNQVYPESTYGGYGASYAGYSNYGGDGASTYHGNYGEDDGYWEDEYWDEGTYWDPDADDEDYYQPPVIELALEHAEEVNPQHKVKSALNVHPTDLNKYGISVVLYFTFMKFLAFSFMWLAVLCIPAILINMGGDGLEKQADPTVQFIEGSTLGNFGRIYEWERGGLGDNETHTAPSIGLAPPAPASYPNDTAHPWEHGPTRSHNFFSFSQPKDELMVGMSYFNMVFLAMFALSAFLIPGVQRKLIKEVDANMCTIEDYSVIITDLPDDVKDQELHKFFDKKVGKVQNVVVATNNAELLTLAFERQKAKELFHIQVAKYKKGREDPDVSDKKVEWLHEEAVKAKKGLRACDSAIRALQNDRGGDAKRAICAFVTFQEEEDFLNVFDMYRPGIFAWLWRPVDLRLRKKHRLRVKQAPPPADIRWENLQFNWAQRSFRQFNISLLTGVVLGLAFISIAAVQMMAANAATPYDTEECRLNCHYGTDPVTMENEDLRNIYLKCYEAEQEGDPKRDITQTSSPPPPPAYGRRLMAQDLVSLQANYVAGHNGTCGAFDSFCYACYCLEHISAGSVLDESEYCQPYIFGYTMQVVAQSVASVIVVVLNLLLKPLLIFLVKFEKHHSASGEQMSVMSKLFLAQFFNTAILLVVLNGSFPWLRAQLEGTPVEGLLFQGEMEDFVPAWYNEVGYALVISMVATPASQRIQTILRLFKFKIGKFFASRNAVTQDQLNRAFEGMDFNLAVNYGELLNILFVTLTFSPGLPILVPLTSFAYMVRYGFDKYEFARVSKMPPWYSTILGMGVAHLMAYACLGYLILAIWANSYYTMAPHPMIERLIGSALYGFCDAWESLPEPLASMFGTLSNPSEMARRALQKNTAIYTMTLFVIVVILFLRGLFSTIRSILAEIYPAYFQTDKRQAEGNPTLDLAIAGSQLLGARTYSIRDAPQYQAAFERIVWEQDDGKL